MISSPLSIRYTRSTQSKPRAYSVVVPARVVAKATLRNRIRRRVSEIARAVLQKTTLPAHTHLLITVHTAQLPETATELREILVLQMKKSGILVQ